MTYTDEEKNIKMTEETNPQKVSVYRAPNVKKIFDYEEPGGGEIKDVEVCANSAQSVVNLNEDKLNYYQYKKGSSAPVPSYESFAKAKDMEIHYFYTDTFYDGMPESNWKDVSGTDMVSTTSDILFFVPGYYKMMITAKNMCNEVGKSKLIRYGHMRREIKIKNVISGYTPMMGQNLSVKTKCFVRMFRMLSL